jgi:hypothetical protein
LSRENIHGRRGKTKRPSSEAGDNRDPEGKEIAPLGKEALRRRFETLVAEKMSQPSSSLGLLGAGRVDPFNSLLGSNAKPYLLEIIGHCRYKPLFHPYPAALLLFLLFHSIIWATSVHLEFIRYGKIFPNGVVPLTHKIEAMKHVNERLGDREESVKGEVIAAILVFAAHETMDESERRPSPFNSPLKEANCLDMYSTFIYVPAHMKAVLNLVAARGSLEHLKLYGLAETIQL